MACDATCGLGRDCWWCCKGMCNNTNCVRLCGPKDLFFLVEIGFVWYCESHYESAGFKHEDRRHADESKPCEQCDFHWSVG